MSFDFKVHCSNCVACNRAKPSRHGSLSLSPLGVSNYKSEIIGMNYVTDLPKSSKLNFSAIMILVCHLTKMAYFSLVTTKETADLFTDNCYKLYGVPKVSVSDTDPRFGGKFLQPYMRKVK